MQKLLKYTLILLLTQSCATYKYVDKEQLKGSISNITEITYTVENGNKKLVTKKEIQLTKNGRINYSETFNANNERIEMTEKKLFFEKKSFPDKEAYYCKTRWKPGQRERISCYTQKKYKANEIIAYYNKDGTVNKIEDNFTDYSTSIYNYNAKDAILETILVLNKAGESIEEITLNCLTEDSKNNCTKLEKKHPKSGKIEIIERTFSYN